MSPRFQTTGMVKLVSAAIFCVIVGVVSVAVSANPVLSAVSDTVRFSWEIPQGGLGTGASFYAVSPAGDTVFLVTSSGIFLPTANYTARLVYQGNIAARNVTFTLSNIQTSDAGTYTCGGGGATSVIQNCGQKLVVLDGPYQISLTPSTSSYAVTEHQALPPVRCSALCRPGCSYRWLHNGTAFSSGAVLQGQGDRSKTGSYRCQPYNTHGSRESVAVSVDVQYPAEVILETQGSATCRPHRVYVGQQNVQLTCRVTAANPVVTSYTWTHNSSVIQSASGHVFTINSVSRTSGGSYTCQGRNDLGGSTSSPVTLEVQYGPSVSVDVSTQTVTEGETMTVTCSVDSKPAAAVTWTRKDGGSFTPQTGSTLTITNIQRSQAGTYACTADNTLSPCAGTSVVRSDSVNVTVDVQYPVTISMFTANTLSGSVTVNKLDTVALSCQIDSNPRSVIRLLNGTEELTRADNSLTATYILESVDCRQRGNYSCTATNNIGKVVTQTVELLVKCAPPPNKTAPHQLKYAARLGSDLTVSVSVLAYPLPTFNWSRSKSTSQNLTGSSSPVSDISATARLHLTNLQQQDFGDYILTVDNGVGGAVQYTVSIVPSGPPSTPTNVSVYSEGPFTLHVSWKEEFNGGANQTFTVEYSTDVKDWKTAGNYTGTGSGNYMTSTIVDLSSGTQYFVRVVAWNEFGSSNYTEHVMGFTEKKLDSATGSPAGLIGGVAGGVTGVVILVMIVVVVMIIRRRGKQDEDTERITSKGREKDKNDKLEMKNDIYESADGAEMQDNVCYASSDEVMKSGASGSQGVPEVYAAVDKKKLKPASKTNEVYAEVKKPGNKTTKKQGAKKEKKPNPKDNKTPQKSKNKRERKGETYENTSIGDEGNPYINHAFDGEPEGATGQATVPLGAKAGRDEDGLLYVGIDFSNHNPSPHVHREEESTEYAGIQIGVVGPPPTEEEKKEEDK